AEEENVPVIKLSPLRPGSQEASPPTMPDTGSFDENELAAEFNALLGNQEQHEILDTSAEQLATVAQTALPEENTPVQPAVAMADPEDDLSVAFGFPEPDALDEVPEPHVEQSALA